MLKLTNRFSTSLAAPCGFRISILSFEIIFLPRTKWGRARAAELAATKGNENTIFIFYIIPQMGLRDRSGKMIILMSSKPVIHAIIATLNEPEPYSEKAAWAEYRFNKCTSNPLIVIANLTMNGYKADLELFKKAEADMSSRLHTNTEIRDKAWVKVKTHVQACMAVAQSNSNDNILMGIEIIQSGGFGIKHVPAHEAHIFHATNNGPGMMYVEAAGADPHATHDWEVSTDGIHWVAYLSTHKAHFIAKGLPQVAKVWFRHRARIDDEPIPDWELIYVTVI